MLIITGVKYKYWTFEMTSKFYLFIIIATTIMSIIIRFFSRIFVPLFKKFKFILMNSFSILNKLYIRQYKVINFILYIFIGITTYLFLYDLTSIKVIRIFIFTLISLAVSMYISDNYTISKNIFIKILQKLVFLILKISLIIILIPIIYSYYPYLYSYYIIIILNNLFKIKWLVCLIDVLAILYNILILYFLNKYSTRSEAPILSKYLPSFVRNEILSLYELSQQTEHDKSIIIGLILKSIIAYILLLLFLLATLLIS